MVVYRTTWAVSCNNYCFFVFITRLKMLWSRNIREYGCKRLKTKFHIVRWCSEARFVMCEFMKVRREITTNTSLLFYLQCLIVSWDVSARRSKDVPVRTGRPWVWTPSCTRCWATESHTKSPNGCTKLVVAPGEVSPSENYSAGSWCSLRAVSRRKSSKNCTHKQFITCKQLHHIFMIQIIIVVGFYGRCTWTIKTIMGRICIRGTSHMRCTLRINHCP